MSLKFSLLSSDSMQVKALMKELACEEAQDITDVFSEPCFVNVPRTYQSLRVTDSETGKARIVTYGGSYHAAEIKLVDMTPPKKREPYRLPRTWAAWLNSPNLVIAPNFTKTSPREKNVMHIKTSVFSLLLGMARAMATISICCVGLYALLFMEGIIYVIAMLIQQIPFLCERGPIMALECFASAILVLISSIETMGDFLAMFQFLLFITFEPRIQRLKAYRSTRSRNS